jgi:hypothetical protein
MRNYRLLVLPAPVRRLTVCAARPASLVRKERVEPRARLERQRVAAQGRRRSSSTSAMASPPPPRRRRRRIGAANRTGNDMWARRPRTVPEARAISVEVIPAAVEARRAGPASRRQPRLRLTGPAIRSRLRRQVERPRRSLPPPRSIATAPYAASTRIPRTLLPAFRARPTSLPYARRNTSRRVACSIRRRLDSRAKSLPARISNRPRPLKIRATKLSRIPARRSSPALLRLSPPPPRDRRCQTAVRLSEPPIMPPRSPKRSQPVTARQARQVPPLRVTARTVRRGTKSRCWTLLSRARRGISVDRLAPLLLVSSPVSSLIALSHQSHRTCFSCLLPFACFPSQPVPIITSRRHRRPDPDGCFLPPSLIPLGSPLVDRQLYIK